jgi:hypothetical protein
MWLSIGMNKVSDIIDALGGPVAVATHLSAGVAVPYRVERQTVSNWKLRESIPGDYWFEIVLMARAKKVPGINHVLLARLHSRLPRISRAA